MKTKDYLRKIVATALVVSQMTVISSAQTKDLIRISVGDIFQPAKKVVESIKPWEIRKYDVIIRIGEYEGKSGKRVYIDGYNLDIPKDIPIRTDAKGSYISEFDINKKIGTRLYEELLNRGVNVKLQMASSKKEDLNAAGRISNKDNPKLYLSVHTNSFNETSNGYFFMFNEGNRTAFNIAQRLSDSIQFNNQVKQCANRANDGYIGELNTIHNSTIGILGEFGFFSNYSELEEICSDEYSEYIANNMSIEIESILNDYWA